MRLAHAAVVALLTIATGSQALAQADVVMAPRNRTPSLLEAYTAYIGNDDLFNSSGTRLTRPAAILRQDRANFHAYGLRQRGDQGDGFFASQGNRAALEGMLSAGRMSPAAARIMGQTTGLSTRATSGAPSQSATKVRSALSYPHDKPQFPGPIIIPPKTPRRQPWS